MAERFNLGALRRLLAGFRETQKARTAVESGLESARQELQDIAAKLVTAQADLKQEEIEIALSGASVPDAPLPSEKAISRLRRAERITETRCEILEEKLKSAKGAETLASEAVEREWEALARKDLESIQVRYREAATALKIAFLESRVWSWYFQASDMFRGLPRWPAVRDLGSPSDLIRAAFFHKREEQEAAVPELSASIRTMRAEIEAQRST
jgi:hypothetical protein